MTDFAVIRRIRKVRPTFPLDPQPRDHVILRISFSETWPAGSWPFPDEDPHLGYQITAHSQEAYPPWMSPFLDMPDIDL